MGENLHIKGNTLIYNFYIVTFLVLSAFSVPALSADQQTTREEMQEHYIDQVRDQKTGLFGSAPIEHIVPKANNINFATNVSYDNVVIAPSSLALTEDLNDLKQKISISGWSIEALVAFSAKRFGIGFVGNYGQKKVTYLQESGSAETIWRTNQNMSYQEEPGSLSYSGVGMYGYFTPKFSFVPAYVRTTVMGGIKNLSVVHYHKGVLTSHLSQQEEKKYRYQVSSKDLGLNVGVNLAKRFNVIPWLNYSQQSLSGITDGTGNSLDIGLDPLLLDRELVWGAAPSLTYGVDFSVWVGKFDLHLGGVLGFLANFSRGSDRIQDDSLSISLSYNIKGN